MKRRATAVFASVLFVYGQAAPLLARGSGGGGGGGGRGSVSGASRGGSGGGGSWQGRNGNVSGSRSVTQTGSGYNVNRQASTAGGASREVNRDVSTSGGQVESVNRTSTATNASGQSVHRDRTTTNEGGAASVQGNASTSTGRAASGQGAVGKNAYGQTVAAGSVDTKYKGSYAGAARQNPNGTWNTATAGPNGVRVTRTLPSGYKTTTYAGTSYYAYGSVYYRPYTYYGVPYYYPVPPPYYYQTAYVPVGAIVVTVAAMTYMMSEGSYYQQTTSSQGQVVYQTVPAPQGASLKTLPVERVLVTVAGTTYYLYANTFYRRVVQSGQESFVVVTAPAGVVVVAALPANFEVIQLNTLYFAADAAFYVRYLAPDGKELYVAVDPPPQPALATAPGPGAAPAPQPPAPAPTYRTVAESLTVPAGALVLVRMASTVSSTNAHVGDRFQGFLDHDLAASGRLIAAQGSRVFGQVVSVDEGSKIKGQPALGITLTDIEVGGHVVAITTQPVVAKGEKGTGAKKMLGGAALGAGIGAIADGGQGAAIGVGVGLAAGGVATAASSQDAATVAAQSVQSFTVAVPFNVQTATQVVVN
jgi:hypothetical protein